MLTRPDERRRYLSRAVVDAPKAFTSYQRAQAMSSTVADPRGVGSRRWWALGAVFVTILCVGIDSTVLSVALPTLAKALDASESDLQWFSSGYFLVLAAAMLPAGLLGDRFAALHSGTTKSMQPSSTSTGQEGPCSIKGFIGATPVQETSDTEDATAGWWYQG